MKMKVIISTVLLALLLVAGVSIASARYESSGALLPVSNSEETPPSRPTPTPPLRPTATPPAPPVCELDEVEQLVVKKLALHYQVSEDEIAEWYCHGYGFGEIAIAYEISERTDYTVDELFSMRADGLGWGEILVELGLAGELPPFRDRMPWPIPPFDFEGKPPARSICMEGDERPIVERLAEMYGLTYDDAYRWVCGPFDYTNFPFPDIDWEEMEGWEYNPGERMRIIAPDNVLPDVNLDDLPALDNLPDLIKDGRPRIRPPRGRP